MMIKQVSVQANGTPENKVCSLLMINVAELMCYHYIILNRTRKATHYLVYYFLLFVDVSDSEPKDDGGANRELSIKQTNASTDCVSQQNRFIGGSTALVL